MRQENDAPRAERARDSTVRVAAISATGTVFAAGLTAVGSFMSGFVTYAGPGAAPLVPPSTVTVSAPPVNSPEPGHPGAGRRGGPVGLGHRSETCCGKHSVNSGPRRVNTRPYSDTLYQYAYCGDKRSIIYQLDRRYDHFEATIGSSDDSRSGFTVFFTVTVDDREVLKEQVVVGQSRPIRADVSGGYRRTISVISERSEGQCPSSDLIAVWAEPRLTSGS